MRTFTRVLGLALFAATIVLLGMIYIPERIDRTELEVILQTSDFIDDHTESIYNTNYNVIAEAQFMDAEGTLDHSRYEILETIKNNSKELREAIEKLSDHLQDEVREREFDSYLVNRYPGDISSFGIGSKLEEYVDAMVGHSGNPDNRESILNTWELTKNTIETSPPEVGHYELTLLKKRMAEFETKLVGSTFMPRYFKYPEDLVR